MRAIPLAGMGVVMSAALAMAGSWPQFRGQDGNGLAVGTFPLPTEISPEHGVKWKVAIPQGISSPTVTPTRIFLTASDSENGKLYVLAFDRSTGAKIWQQEVPPRGDEEIHSIGSHAQSTPVTDGERVISFFGSAGMFCHDTDGNLLWQIPMGPFKNNFGAGSSPILVGNKVILNQDHDTDSFLMAIDKWTGKTIWKTDRSSFPRGYATPVLWKGTTKPQIVIAGTLQVKGYDLETGEEVWSVGGISRIVNMTPTVGPDGTLYVPAWSPGADENDRIEAPPFDDALREIDENKNGTIEKNEVRDGALKQRFDQIDRDKDGHISREEHESMRNVFEQAKNVLVAIRPGEGGYHEFPCPLDQGGGDSTSLRSQSRGVQRPFVHGSQWRDRFERRRGQWRTGQEGTHLLARRFLQLAGRRRRQGVFLQQGGEVSVISAEPQWKELHHADFKEEIMATPAIVDGMIFLRTRDHLYCLTTSPTGTAGLFP
ncbi:MAG: PQQ-binding-like beta-propeller repeat protein [Planctomycetota bacterium]